ncbi:TetR/AcrR family transcriptional regulator [Pseudooceanicola sp. C21-150M6]|uniref:TetR/AcrR family transcriptional regulator n=1 Tax=Pseudooceanicola sp. C21-150M6 TaxID=3434355 RepID=UPI003D7F5F2A
MAEKRDKRACAAPEEAPRSKGRPVVMRPEERRRIILATLDEMFREVGLAGMTMSAIARSAGMSKQKLYDLFEDRDALFEAYLSDSYNVDIDPPDPDDDADFETRLRRMFRFDQPSQAWDLPIALFRLAIAEAAHHPRLARRCLEEGPRNKQARMKKEIERAVQRGELSVSDTSAAAQLLMDMLHLPIIEALASPQFHPSTRAWESRFELGLKVFRHGIS